MAVLSLELLSPGRYTWLCVSVTFPFWQDSVQMTTFCAQRGQVWEAPKLSCIPALPRKDGRWAASSVFSQGRVSRNYLKDSPEYQRYS